ncbi:MAG: glycerol-3-phosphate 1-O-acyltransferase PlsY [Bacilli bacterium]|nr:glycerol-3-phosphate 1-O-acyltransferase PlsY [Bacilli bacterium]
MNIYSVNILVGIVVAAFSYLCGGIPTGVIISKVFFHKDIREFGSKNSGGTNAGRVLGKGVGILVIILDMIKTIIPFYLAWALLTYVPRLNEAMHWENGYFAAPLYYWGSALFAALGHCWSVFLRFKGGKAVSCFMGVNVLTSWIEFVCAGFTFLGVAKFSKFISLSSIIASIVGTVTAWTIAIIAVAVPWNPHWLTWLITIEEAPYLGFEFAIVNTLISAILIIRHQSNIQRLRNGTESINPFAKEQSK